MASEKSPNGGWKRARSSYQRGDAQKAGSLARVSRTGAVQGAVDSTKSLLDVARARGLTQGEFLLDFWGNEEKGQVGCIPVPITSTSPGTGSVRWDTKKGSPRASFHIGGVFKDYPDLAPKSDCKCMVGIDTAPDGLPMLVIAVKAGLGTQTTSHTPPQGSSGQNPA